MQSGGKGAGFEEGIRDEKYYRRGADGLLKGTDS